jgi:hypothetical protein
MVSFPQEKIETMNNKTRLRMRALLLRPEGRFESKKLIFIASIFSNKNKKIQEMG